jgi:hypothetical protein
MVSTPGGVEVVIVEPHRFAAAHAGHREQPDQRLEGRRLERVAQRAGGGHQRGDVRIGVDAGRDAASPGRQQPGGRYLGVRVHGLQVPGEAADHAQPLRGPYRARAIRLGRPSSGQIDGDRARPGGLGESGEVRQEPALLGQLEAQGPAQFQVIGGMAAELAHRGLPGQGRASGDRASRSALA